MVKSKRHPIKRWEVSLIELKNNAGKKYKVTRRIHDLSVSETKVFRSKKRAKKQFDNWLK